MKLLLDVRDLTKSFPTNRSHTLSLQLLSKLPLPRKIKLPQKIMVFEKISLQIHPGECLGIEGPNGCGKSTFLRCIAGVMSPSSGHIYKYGNIVSLLSHGFGAYEELPVWKNLLLVQQLFGTPLPEAKKNLPALAKIAKLENRLHSVTTELSEGMRAKIALSALFLARFDLLLLDESLNHVDADFRNTFHQVTRKWLNEGRSVLLTSHDPNVIDYFATRRMRLSVQASSN